MEKEIVEESKIIKAASSLKSKITKENIKKYSSKYRTPFDNKIIAIVASIISTCCMLFVDAFEFAHKYDYSFKKNFYEAFGETLYDSANNHSIYSLFQYNLDSTEAITIFEVLTVVFLLAVIIFVLLNRSKISLAASSGSVLIMLITLFRDSYYEAVVGSMTITPLTWYYVIWVVVVLAFFANVYAFVKTKKVVPVIEAEQGKTEEAASENIAAEEAPEKTEVVAENAETGEEDNSSESVVNSEDDVEKQGEQE